MLPFYTVTVDLCIVSVSFGCNNTYSIIFGIFAAADKAKYASMLYNIFHFVDGDLGAYADAKKAYMKQKHRMVWERRNGKLSEQT